MKASEVKKILTKEFFDLEYTQNRKSQQQLVRETGICEITIRKYMTILGIKIRKLRDCQVPFPLVYSETEKYCPMCKRVLPLSEYHKSSRAFLKVACYCKECSSIKSKKVHDRNNKDKAKNKAKLVMEFGNKCSVCGAENLPIVCYAFHHINPKEKEIQPSDTSTYLEKEIIDEIKNKCVMVCFNCHQIIHHNNKTALDLISSQELMKEE